MGTNVAILMCHGAQSRMGDYEGYKQLVPVCGESLVGRTERLLREISRTTLVRLVAPQADPWPATARALGADLMETPDPLFLAALPGVIPKGLALDRLLVLCGDVVFSPEILRGLVAAQAPVAFAGRFVPNIFTGRAAGELFGFSVHGAWVPTFVKRIQEMLSGVEEMRAQLQAIDPTQVAQVMEKNLRLWLLMHTLEDEGFAKVIECKWTDYIDDIDGLDDLERLPKIEEVIRRRAALERALEAR